MKKRLLSILLAAVMTVSIAGCSESRSSSESSETGDGYTKEVKFDNVTIYLPEDATETDDSTADCKWYDTSFGKIGIDISMSAKNDWHAVDIIESWKKNTKTTKNFKQIMIDNEKALSFECESGDEKQPSVCIGFNTSGAHSLTILIRCKESMERANEEYEKLLKHITIDSSQPTQTTTTTTTASTTTTPSAKDAFNEKYGKLPTWKDVKYDPISYIGKNFIITDATYEIDDYYNFDYRDTEGKYFVFSAEPPGAYISDRLYIYADRTKFDWLFKKLKEGRLKGNIVVKAEYKDSTKQGMATLVDTE